MINFLQGPVAHLFIITIGPGIELGLFYYFSFRGIRGNVRKMYFIFEEKVSGATKDREQLQKMLEDLQESDIIYVTDLTRIIHSIQNLFE